ncbi:MAG: 2-oxoacid:ferredoxin oxidoreductase subunit beta, partial [bacterium]|nr:2-oxoacid:ferredoxin oxidoreductase subunit beta [bacterium]
HHGSTKSYQYTRDNYNQLVYADFVPPAHEIQASYDEGDVRTVGLHDGSSIRFRKVPGDYDPTDRDAVYGYIRERQRAGEVATGLLYVEGVGEVGEEADFHGIQGTVEEPLVDYPFAELCPGAERLERLQERFR